MHTDNETHPTVVVRLKPVAWFTARDLRAIATELLGETAEEAAGLRSHSGSADLRAVMEEEAAELQRDAREDAAELFDYAKRVDEEDEADGLATLALLPDLGMAEEVDVGAILGFWGFGIPRT